MYTVRRTEREGREKGVNGEQGEIFCLVEPSPLFERAFKASSLLHD